jgi:hypothetical protein
MERGEREDWAGTMRFKHTSGKARDMQQKIRTAATSATDDRTESTRSPAVAAAATVASNSRSSTPPSSADANMSWPCNGPR